MKVLPLALFGVLGTASAQLQVSTPTTPSCTPEQTPVIGIAVQSYLGGDYGVNLTDDLKDALEAKGFSVVPDFAYPMVDKASILLKGEINHWQNVKREQSRRVGEAHLTISSTDTGTKLLNLDQKNAGLVFNAPEASTFIQNVVKVVTQKFCQTNN